MKTSRCYRILSLSLAVVVAGCASKEVPGLSGWHTDDDTRLHLFMEREQAEALFETSAQERKVLVYTHPQLGEIREELVAFELKEYPWSTWSTVLSFQGDSLSSVSMRRQIAGIWPPYEQGHMDERLQWRLAAVKKVHGIDGKIIGTP